jgi:hypothetical protein
MASPDMSRYIDLTVNDLQPIEIYDASVEYAKTALPEWEPVPGSVEDALLQAASSMTGQLIGAINRLPSGVLEGLLQLYGIDRNAGTAATAIVEFTTLDNATGYTIPIGTRVGYVDTVGDEPVLFVFETTETAVLAIGQTTANIPVVGVSFQQYPALQTDDPLQLLSAISFIEEVKIYQNYEPGSNPESDTAFLDRAVTILGSFSESLTLPAQVDRYALANYPSVYRAKTYSRVRADRPIVSLVRSSDVATATLSASCTVEAGDIVRVVGADTEFNGLFVVDGTTPTTVYWTQDGENASASVSGELYSLRFQDDWRDEETLEYTPQNGYATVYVSAIGGASTSISNLTLETLQEDLIERTVAGLITHVDIARVASVGVQIEVEKQNAVSIATVTTAIEEAIDDYLHPDHWSWGDAIYVNELIALVDGVAGVVRVKSIVLDDSVGDGLTELDEDGNIVFVYSGVLPLHDTSVTVS